MYIEVIQDTAYNRYMYLKKYICIITVVCYTYLLYYLYILNDVVAFIFIYNDYENNICYITADTHNNATHKIYIPRMKS